MPEVIVHSAIAIAVLAGGLAPSSAPPTDEIVLPDGVTMFVEYPRYLNLWRRVDLAVDNETGSGITVVDLALRTPLFEDLPADEPDYTVHPHLRQDVPATLGAAVCPAPDGPSMVELTIEYEGERQHGLLEVAAEPLERVNATECNQRMVLETVDIEFGPEFETTDGVVATTIELRRRSGDERIALTATRGSVVLNITMPDVEPLTVLDSGDEAASVPVGIHVARCGPHAAAESKRTFQLAMWVTVGESEEIFVVVELTGELRARLEQLIVDCLEATAG